MTLSIKVVLGFVSSVKMVLDIFHCISVKEESRRLLNTFKGIVLF